MARLGAPAARLGVFAGLSTLRRPPVHLALVAQCDPNTFKQRVFCDHNSRLPRVAFFALRDIPPLEELAYDYGYADVPGKTMPCLCGAANCQKLLY